MSLVFYQKSHRYKLDGAWVPGVTTLIGKGLPKPAIPYWAAKTVAEWVADNPDLTEDLKRMGGRGPAIAFLKELPWQARDTAAIRGTEVHSLAERLAAGESVDVPEHLAGYVRACVGFLDDWGLQPEVTERPCASRKWAHAGTLDFIGRIADGRRVIGDWKTSSGVYPEAAIQLSAYRYSEFYVDENDEEQPMPEVDTAVVVHLQDGYYEVHEMKADEDTYKAFLGVSWLSLVTTAFTLAKMLRDRHEADVLEARLQGRREAAQARAGSVE